MLFNYKFIEKQIFLASHSYLKFNIKAIINCLFEKWFYVFSIAPEIGLIDISWTCDDPEFSIWLQHKVDNKSAYKLDYTRGAGGPQGLVSNHLKIEGGSNVWVT